MSIVLPYSAAPQATAVIGSMLVSTLGVTCSRNILLIIGECVGPPTRIKAPKSFPLRLFRSRRLLVMSIAFWKIGATMGWRSSCVMVMSSSNSVPLSSYPYSSPNSVCMETVSWNERAIFASSAFGFHIVRKASFFEHSAISYS